MPTASTLEIETTVDLRSRSAIDLTVCPSCHAIDEGCTEAVCHGYDAD